MRKEVMTFNDTTVSIRRRRGQRSLRVHVRQSGEVVVTSGFSLPQKLIWRFLNESWSWVEQTQEKMKRVRAGLPRWDFRQGDQLPFLGQALSLQYVRGTGARRFVRKTADQLMAHVPHAEWDRFNPSEAHPDWQPVIRRFYRSEAEVMLTSRVQALSVQMNLAPERLIFRCQKTRWGSCGSDGCISLNWRLVATPEAVIDYVIIHELAHLTHPNHSVRFWSLVQHFCPTFKAHVKWLRQHHGQFDFLLPTTRSD